MVQLKPGEKGKMAEKEQFGDTFETTQWRKIKRQKGEMVEKECKCRSPESVYKSRGWLDANRACVSPRFRGAATR